MIINKDYIFGTENKRWARILDCIILLLFIITLGALRISEPNVFQDLLLSYGFWGTIITAPILMYMVVRVSDLNRTERLAIVIFVISTLLVFMGKVA